MPIVETRLIARTPDQVWPFVVNARHFMKWNDRVLELSVSDDFREGLEFTTRYGWKGRNHRFRSVALEVVPGRRLVLRHDRPTGEGARPDMVATETITLAGSGGQTRVTKEVVTANDGVPWLFGLLLSLVARFGRPVGKDLLKALCEADGPPSP